MSHLFALELMHKFHFIGTPLSNPSLEKTLKVILFRTNVFIGVAFKILYDLISGILKT